MIINAKDKPLTYTGLPQMGEVLPSWFQPMTFTLVTKSLVDYEVQEVLVTVTTQGVRQPMSAQELAIKPEGQRGWKWETIHCLPNVKLKLDDIIIFDTVKYRVMQKWDWSEYGYLEYHICQAYEGGE
jgi:hypothetical protein